MVPVFDNRSRHLLAPDTWAVLEAQGGDHGVTTMRPVVTRTRRGFCGSTRTAPCPSWRRGGGLGRPRDGRFLRVDPKPCEVTGFFEG
jgi:hypothetical protein